MIPKECKRLAEVDFPIAVVSKHSATEKAGPKGYPNMLHLWWARRPLAACRAMLLALLWPDPCDSKCPEEFKQEARAVLAPMQGRPGPNDEDLREALLRFIGDFANWDRSADPVYLDASRALVKAAHSDELPLVVDPFAGGGSIPLEALRVGCETFASDLNPVACLILKGILEDIPRSGRILATKLSQTGAEIKADAEKKLAKFYPSEPDGAWPIAYLWARTVRCEAPNCGAEIPLMRSFWLCKKPNRKRALKYRVIRSDSETPQVEFEVFEPDADSEVPNGTVTRAKATCLCCNRVLTPERVRAHLAEQKGGADTVFDAEGKRAAGATLLAVVEIKAGEQGKFYRVAEQRDYEAVWRAQSYVKWLAPQQLENGLSVIPNESLPPIGTLGFRVQRYGIWEWGDLFTARQKAALSFLLSKTRSHWRIGDPKARLLAMAFSRVAMSDMSCTRWNAVAEKMQHTFGRQALPMVWDFAEVVPIANAPGNWKSGYELITDIVTKWPNNTGIGQAQLADACDSPLSSDAAGVWFTDPPYYDAVPYADLSDFFFVWLKRGLNGEPFMRDIFDPVNPLTPKALEIVQDETKQAGERKKDKAWFEERMATAFTEGRRILKDDGVGCVVFAHKTTEGWEALLSGMIKGGWTITGSWPIATEMASRLRARDSAALATSVHLVCRPRPENAATGDWSEVLRELPKRVGDWMERLQKEHIRGADLVFACIGPALEIFSRYSKVETAEGNEVTLGEYLQKVWEVVGRSALEQVLGTAEAQARNGGAGALEEDARLTALFLWTLQSTNDEVTETASDEAENEETKDDDEEGGSKGKPKGFSLIFDVARRFAQPLGIHLPEWEGRIIETKKGIVRLLAVSERAEQLFGREGTQTVADRIEQTSAVDVQGMLFPELEQRTAPRIAGKRRRAAQGAGADELRTNREPTTLDRVHAAMLLQAGGRSNALRALIKAEQERGPYFLRLANALSALYPRNSEEKRLVDAMLLAVPR
jgi:adenine-specific DNA methylase